MVEVAGRRDRLVAPRGPTALAAALGFLGALMVLLIVVGFGTLWVGDSRFVGADLVAMLLHTPAVVAFGAAGLVAWNRRPHNRIGRLMVAMAGALWLSGLVNVQPPMLHRLGLTLGSLPLAIVLQLLLSFPSGRLGDRLATAVVTVGYLVAVTVPLTRWLVPGYRALDNLLAGVGVLALLISVPLVLRRTRPARTPFRGPFITLAYAGSGLLLVLGAAVVLVNADMRESVQIAAAVAQVAALTVLAALMVAALLGGPYGRAGEVEEFARSISSAAHDAGELDATLARSLGDPSSRMLYTDDADGGWLDAEGARVAAAPNPGRGRWIVTDGRREVGAIDYNIHLVDEPNLLAAVAPSVAVATAHRRLVVELQSLVLQLEHGAHELAESRRRILSAADAERRRISRDLHDGAQQKIVTLGISAQRIGRRAGDPGFVREVADDLTVGLTALLDDLRRLVHGLVPAALAEHGLAAAVRGAVADLPLRARVRVDLGPTKLAADVESAAYYVVAEAATNVVKHSGATEVQVDIGVERDTLSVMVWDNGAEVGSQKPGFGLLSLQDRVHALGGRFTVTSEAGSGMTVRAEIPCG